MQKPMSWLHCFVLHLFHVTSHVTTTCCKSNLHKTVFSRGTGAQTHWQLSGLDMRDSQLGQNLSESKHCKALIASKEAIYIQIHGPVGRGFWGEKYL